MCVAFLGAFVLWVDEAFADSKTLNHEKRTGLLSILSGHSEHMGWSVRVLWYVDVFYTLRWVTAGLIAPRRYQAGC